MSWGEWVVVILVGGSGVLVTAFYVVSRVADTLYWRAISEAASDVRQWGRARVPLLVYVLLYLPLTFVGAVLGDLAWAIAHEIEYDEQERVRRAALSTELSGMEVADDVNE